MRAEAVSTDVVVYKSGCGQETKERGVREVAAQLHAASVVYFTHSHGRNYY